MLFYYIWFFFITITKIISGWFSYINRGIISSCQSLDLCKIVTKRKKFHYGKSLREEHFWRKKGCCWIVTVLLKSGFSSVCPPSSMVLAFTYCVYYMLIMKCYIQLKVEAFIWQTLLCWCAVLLFHTTLNIRGHSTTDSIIEKKINAMKYENMHNVRSEVTRLLAGFLPRLPWKVLIFIFILMLLPNLWYWVYHSAMPVGTNPFLNQSILLLF